MKLERKAFVWIFQAANKQTLTQDKLGHGYESENLCEKLNLF